MEEVGGQEEEFKNGSAVGERRRDCGILMGVYVQIMYHT